MSDTVIVGLLALIGSCFGTLGGIYASNKLVVYRISQLEEKVSKHNNLVERMYKVESRVTLLEEETHK